MSPSGPGAEARASQTGPGRAPSEPGMRAPEAPPEDLITWGRWRKSGRPGRLRGRRRLVAGRGGHEQNLFLANGDRDLDPRAHRLPLEQAAHRLERLGRVTLDGGIGEGHALREQVGC